MKNFVKNALFSIVIFFGALTFLASYPVNAQNVTITDLGLTGPQTIQIYMPNGSLVGTYNTTSNNVILPLTDFMMVIKPETWNVLADPGNVLALFMAAIETYAVPIIVLVLILGLITWKPGGK